MPPQSQQKIYLDQEYPCPCHLKGTLQQIALTEAFGCDRCQRIFVMQADGLTIEELAATYPYKRRYYWDGTRFHSVKPFAKGGIGRSPERWGLWLQCLGVIALVLVLVQLYSTVTLTVPLFYIVISMAIAIVFLTALAIWLVDRG